MSALPITRNAARRRQTGKAARGDHRSGKLWYAIRVLRKFPASELCAVAEIDNKPFVLAFLNKLRHAGYLRNVQNRKNEEATWILIRNTGPLCPSLLQRCTVVWDHNEDRAYLVEPTPESLREVQP